MLYENVRILKEEQGLVKTHTQVGSKWNAITSRTQMNNNFALTLLANTANAIFE